MVLYFVLKNKCFWCFCVFFITSHHAAKYCRAAAHCKLMIKLCDNGLLASLIYPWNFHTENSISFFFLCRYKLPKWEDKVDSFACSSFSRAWKGAPLSHFSSFDCIKQNFRGCLSSVSFIAVLELVDILESGYEHDSNPLIGSVQAQTFLVMLLVPLLTPAASCCLQGLS